MTARVVVYLGVVLLGVLLLLERPTPMAIAPPAGEPTSSLPATVPQG